MSKWLSLPIVAMLFTLMLAACGGGDDDNEPTVTATTGAAATAMATNSAGGAEADLSPTASGTKAIDTTPTTKATAPSRPIATQAPTRPAATEPPSDGQDVTDLEAQMLDTLLQPEDFPDDWTQDAFGLMEPDDDEDDELCGQPPFPSRDQRIAAVEAQYSQNTDQLALVFHNITVFPEGAAMDAVAYARDISSCGEWTDSDGVMYTILPLEDPGLGDESFAAAISFDVEGTPLYGEYTYVRVGGAIATVAFMVVEGTDVTSYQELVGVAAQRLVDAVNGSEGASGELAKMLLVADDIALIDSVNTWEVGNPVDPTVEDRYAACDAPTFADALGAVDEAGHDLNSDNSNEMFAMHSVVQMAEGDGAVTMEWIRSELSCSSWSDEDTNYEIIDSGDLAVGDDSWWLIVTVTAADGGDRSAQVGFSFTQIGDLISVVALAATNTIDAEFFGSLIALAAEKVNAYVE